MMSYSRAKVTTRKSDMKDMKTARAEDKLHASDSEVKRINNIPHRMPRSLSTAGSRKPVKETTLKAKSFVEKPSVNTPKDTDLTSCPEVTKDVVDPSVPEVDTKSETSESRKASAIPLRKSGNSAKAESPSPKKPPPIVKPVPSLQSKSGSFARVSPTAKQSLEIQFRTKKKRFDMLKRELLGKQKPALELYQALVELKKKLEQSGAYVHLDEMKFIDCEYNTQQQPKHSSPAMDALKAVIEKFMSPVMDYCKSLMLKRADMLQSLETNPDALKNSVAYLKLESEKMEKQLEDMRKEKEKNLTNMINYFEKALESSNTTLEVPSHFEEKEDTEQIKQVLKETEQKLVETNKFAQDLQNDVRKKNAMIDDLNKYKHHVNDLKQKVKQLETELENERKHFSETKNKSQNFDFKLKTLKARLHDSENKAKDVEQRYNDSEEKIRILQENIKSREIQWAREREDLQKNIKSQEMMIQKLTADRMQLETRVRSGNELIRDNDNKFLVKIDKLRAELEAARSEAIDARREKEELQRKCEYFNEQLTKARVEGQQAVNLMTNRREDGKDDPCDESETQLYTELLTTKLTLRDYEEKIKMYEMEKLKFLDTISCLSGNKENESDNIKQKLLRQEETILRLEATLKQKDQIIQDKTILVENLEAEVRNLKERLTSTLEETEKIKTSQDLMKLIRESNLKLNEAMNKSLEDEQRINLYQHEIEKKDRQISDMENLVKVRDGLIGMLKVKKDELASENESLRKYANEVRNLLLEAKNDLKSRTEIIQELSMNLDDKERTCYKLEKKVQELEGVMIVNNEKRFKLQDALGMMEKELQNTKARINQLTETSRYAPGMLRQMYGNQSTRNINYTTPSILSQELLQVSIENMDIIRRRLHNLTQIQAYSLTGREGITDDSCSEYSVSECDLKEFINHAHTLSEHDTGAVYSLSTTQYDTLTCHETTSMQIKNILIARDVVSRSMSKIRQDIENSIRLIQNK